jgi:hypothetical protein
MPADGNPRVRQKDLHTINQDSHHIPLNGWASISKPHLGGSGSTVKPYLNGRAVSLQSNDLSNQFVIPHTDKLIHGSSAHFVGNDDRPGNLADIPEKTREKEC